MKHSSKNKKHVAQPQPRPVTMGPKVSPKRWAVLGLCLLIAGGGTWAFLEFVLWNKLPSELVGTWEVVQGPPEYKEAEFQFYRSGKMIGRVNDNGNLGIINAEVRVEDDKIYATSRRPRTGEEHVSVQTIRTLDERQLVVADEQGRIMKMVRKP